MTSEQRRTLAAATARILPSDDGPGAVEAGAAAYVEGALRHEVFQRGVVEWFEGNLEALGSKALARYSKDFADCDPEDRDALLHQHRQDLQAAGGAFLDLLVGLTLEGFLGDPAHGGNRERAGWRYIGYEPRDLLGGFSLDDFLSSEKFTEVERPAGQLLS